MATLVKSSFHARSISLPKTDHPLSLSVEEKLCRLRSSSELASTSSISSKLGDLKELYERVEDVLQMPLTQQALFHKKNNKMIENALDGSLRLLDICGTTRDVFSQMKECLQELESSLRRRRGGKAGFVAEVERYMTSRKKLNKMIVKCFYYSKKMQKNCTLASLDNDFVLNMLKEVEQISLNVFESLLLVICLPKAKLTSKSFMPRLLLQSKSSSDGNEVQKIESELLLLCKSNKSVEFAQSKFLLKRLESLESSIQGIEEELACVFRRLVKTRVSFLNTLN